ncbi:thiosulfate sulfurtransferase GlpE [Nitrincola tapanii]|uniref:Thiosulfate sulfurtransferase GlpE n=1 Tax=Nitrincola tapanii TaxID=1708751 RepID=A0A5A9W0B2_9GAMM|nr:thiosulfate sulfurtransferase GlpE [Nitrincola tapanii]KAA0873555.1 thiosulfate sulfurtransferase GlpE [Nitrincola tapanii]
MSFQNISANDARELIEQGAQIVDIRDPHSFAAGRLPQACNLNNENLPEFLAQANFDQALIVCCYHGVSSQQAAEYLSQQGFNQVFSLDGGFELWKQLYPELCEA